MRLIKSPKRYRCDYCRHISTESYMRDHEKICWRNPNRYCDFCENVGHYEEDDNPGSFIDCPYCSKYDATLSPQLSKAKEVK